MSSEEQRGEEAAFSDLPSRHRLLYFLYAVMASSFFTNTTSATPGWTSRARFRAPQTQKSSYEEQEGLGWGRISGGCFPCLQFTHFRQGSGLTGGFSLTEHAKQPRISGRFHVMVVFLGHPEASTWGQMRERVVLGS